MEGEEAEKYWLQYLRLCHLDEFTRLFDEYSAVLGQLLGICKSFLDRGITLSQAWDIWRLSFEVNDLYQKRNNLTEEGKNLTMRVNQLSDQNNQLVVQSHHLNFEIANKRMTVEQLNQTIENWNSVLSSIGEDNISYQDIEQIAKEVGNSLLLSRAEVLVCSVAAVILTLQREPNSIPLFMAPFPASQYPGFQDHFSQLVFKVWDELSRQANSLVMTVLFKRLKMDVDNLKRKRT